MPQTLFDNSEAKPFAEYPPTWAYALAVILGAVFPLGLLLAPLCAWLWPSERWKWGLWATLAALPLYACAMAAQGGLLYGAVGALTSPAVLGYIVLACVLAYAASKVKISRSTPKG